MRKHKTLYLSVKLGEIYGIDIFPSAGPNPNLTGMKILYWGIDAFCVRCGRYVYKVTEEFYNMVAGL